MGCRQGWEKQDSRGLRQLGFWGKRATGTELTNRWHLGQGLFAPWPVLYSVMDVGSGVPLSADCSRIGSEATCRWALSDWAWSCYAMIISCGCSLLPWLLPLRPREPSFHLPTPLLRKISLQQHLFQSVFVQTLEITLLQKQGFCRDMLFFKNVFYKCGR